MSSNNFSPLPLPSHLWEQIAAAWQLPPQVARVGERILRQQSDRSIAAEMNLARSTVRSYVTKLLLSSNSRNRLDFVIRVWRKAQEIERQPVVPHGRIIFSDVSTGSALATDFGIADPLFADVRSLRNLSGSESSTEFDAYSHHYVLYQHRLPVGTVAVTRCSDGPIDCQSHYPPRLLQSFGSAIETAFGFSILPHDCSGYLTLRRLMRAVWEDRLPAGSRLHLINATGPLVRVYQKFGYVPIDAARFEHPRLKTPSVPMLLPADPDRPSFCRDLFQQIDRPLKLEVVLEALQP